MADTMVVMIEWSFLKGNPILILLMLAYQKCRTFQTSPILGIMSVDYFVLL